MASVENDCAMISNENGGKLDDKVADTRLKKRRPSKKRKLFTFDNESPKGDIPKGDYCVVSFALDLTVKKLLSEIIHISAYIPSETFSQYVMPYGKICSFSTKYHGMEIADDGFTRMLVDVSKRKWKILKTKSEITALVEFVEWLEKIKEKTGKEGILLVSHELFKLEPCILLKALESHHLLDRFSEVVKGFANSVVLDEVKVEELGEKRSSALIICARAVLEKTHVDVAKADTRASLLYEILLRLCAPLASGDAHLATNEEMLAALAPCGNSVQSDWARLKDMELILERQRSLNMIFGRYISGNFETRATAIPLRKLLMQAGVNYDLLKKAWDEGSDALEELVNDKLKEASPEDKTSLMHILKNHFEGKEEDIKRDRKYFSYRGRWGRIFRQRGDQIGATEQSGNGQNNSSGKSKSDARKWAEMGKHRSKFGRKSKRSMAGNGHGEENEQRGSGDHVGENGRAGVEISENGQSGVVEVSENSGDNGVVSLENGMAEVSLI